MKHQTNAVVAAARNSLTEAYGKLKAIATATATDTPGTDIAKISRKRSKPDKHGHGKGKENTRAGRMLSKSITSPNALIGQSPQRECYVDCEKTHKDARFYTKSHGKEAQVSHHGLPRWQSV
ncbi:hypothetical protein Tco_0739480 [Tanacetum coccineum]